LAIAGRNLAMSLRNAKEFLQVRTYENNMLSFTGEWRSLDICTKLDIEYRTLSPKHVRAVWPPYGYNSVCIRETNPRFLFIVGIFGVSH